MVINKEGQAKDLLLKYSFDFQNEKHREEIITLLEKEIDWCKKPDSQWESSEYLRVLCGYVFCFERGEDAALIKRAKTEINFDVGCIIDEDWITSLSKNDATTIRTRKSLIQGFTDYYKNYFCL
ncbi:MAG: hypothetical protein FWG40_12545 [Peptococcaceae bacterium]|nr:hypothetical protein [Peptococcaceae bacterium]